MTRAALALATLLTLSLNGSLAAASAPEACNAQGVCALSLRMLAPPPPRPADLASRVVAVAARR
ncbi:hypothetical protein [Pararhodobacter aggregans]|uniref:Uncharacterized protein n=1 Tax=Pararhodobacter aggregans TaxID=404875 RepID=A0A2T7UJI5_9RHOB|nr:hypothetical protein [Pararhodobacter aggregans]PTW96686.1 hypothetical protein C8N33_1235 [Pararhodobacter aggregans]PVE44825.1 hypothetical protein DDE23_24450 [Pararhodobacter aggregans]